MGQMAAIKSRSGGSSLFSLSCGCRNSRSAAVSDYSTPSRLHKKSIFFADSFSLSSTTSSHFLWVNPSFEQEDIQNSPTTPTFSDLLRQLGDLERDVKNWAPPTPHVAHNRRNRSSRRVGDSIARVKETKDPRNRSSRRVGDSIAVVKETKDPLGDFRHSMLQMIVENEIVGREGLRNLLGQFLSLNSPLYHEFILRAFGEIWDDVFSGLERTPDLRRHCQPRR